MGGGTKPAPHEKDTFQDGQHKGGGSNEQHHAGPDRASKTPPQTGPDRGGDGPNDAPRTKPSR
jgi:hypothetical protein